MYTHIHHRCKSCWSVWVSLRFYKRRCSHLEVILLIYRAILLIQRAVVLTYRALLLMGRALLPIYKAVFIGWALLLDM